MPPYLAFQLYSVGFLDVVLTRQIGCLRASRVLAKHRDDLLLDKSFPLHRPFLPQTRVWIVGPASIELDTRYPTQFMVVS